MTFHRLSEMTREQVKAVASHSLLVVPVAATEQHGPHLPLGVDTLLTTAIAEQSCETAGHCTAVVLTSTLAFGYSQYHLEHGAAMSLSTKTFQNVLVDLLLSASSSGFKRVFVLNGHGGNDELIRVCAREVVAKHEVTIGAASYWILAADAVQRMSILPSSWNYPGHAGDFETSLMLSLYPSLVQGLPTPRARNHSERGGNTVFKPHLQVGVDGYTDDAREAQASIGDRLMNAIVQEVANHLTSFSTL
ncbi:creatininase family protein [Alicyclobacillus tolerans]|uniref:creatininase family protein n=1 Tax=Alicyclobacillus tolerans TaxID=90970 RepID=UPI001F180294|nr:creatininase family protein [Alicyclobacillus tolerans]MCF8565727.1 creatininase family protein [Alicyclobacillus tolerans]